MRRVDELRLHGGDFRERCQLSVVGKVGDSELPGSRCVIVLWHHSKGVLRTIFEWSAVDW